jgi:hypothetical protein
MSATMILKSSDKQPWYKEPWPWILMAGPGIVIVAGVITTWLAVVSFDGLVSDDYYKQGMTLNQRLQRDHQAEALGLHADVMRSEKNLRLLIGAKGDVKLPEVVTVKLAHPTQAGQDQMVKMTSEGQGFFSGQMATGIAGRWIVSIEDPSGDWRLQGEWLVDSGEALRLVARTSK